MDIRIKKLCEGDPLGDTVGQWLYEEFARPSESADFFKSLVACGSGADGLPAAFAAYADGQPAGAVLLQRADLMSRQDLWPWLACIYVRPQYRGLHIGAQLQLELCRYAAEHGFGRVYLYTDLINYYEKTGWIYAGQCVECDGSAKQLFYRDTEAAHDGR